MVGTTKDQIGQSDSELPVLIKLYILRMVRHKPRSIDPDINPNNFADMGTHNLWVISR